MTDAMEPATTTSPASARGFYARRWLTRRTLLILLPFVIAGLALGLRLQGIDWDGESHYHPDERSIYMRADQMYRTLTNAPGWELGANDDFPLDTAGIPSIRTFFDKDTSPLNPHWFPIGTIIIYILVAVRALLLEPFMDRVSLNDLASAGRTLAAIVDTGSVLMLYFLGRRLFDRRVGLLASALGAFTVINIQLTHFYRPESFVILLALASFWWMLNVLEHGRRRDHILLGLMVGLSFAFRASGAPLLFPVFATYGILVWRSRQAWPERGRMAAVAAVAPRALLAGAVSFVTFAVLQPYALLDATKFFGDLGWEAGIAQTAGKVAYTVQYVGTPRNGLYEIRQSAVWALGLPLGIVAWTGLAISVGVAFFRQRTGELLLLAWVVPLFLIIAMFEVKFLRYIAPVLPVMVLLGSRWLVAGYDWAKGRGGLLLPRLAVGVIAFVLVSTAWYALAFVGMYDKDHPGIQASTWMNANADPRDVVLTDNHWDEGFANLGRFRVAQLPMYEGDTFVKVSRISGQLAGADYIMAYSNRPWGSIVRLPERYPYSSNYYNALFAGELGYELVQGFERYPSFAGVTFQHDPFTRAGIAKPSSIPGVDVDGLALDLGWADENVVNYDHPLVLVWENTGQLEASKIQQIMLGGDAPLPERAMLSPAAVAEQRAGGTWASIFNEGGLNRLAPWLVWLLAIEFIFLATLPLAVRTLRWLPDRGVVLARPLGLLLVSWIVWMGASTGIWSFSRASVAASVLIVGAISSVLFWRNRAVMIAHARRHWRYLVGVEVLFLVAFFVFLMIREANPDLWHQYRGGEKPMDLAYLTAVVKSTTFPPYDPWYAGGLINYYYFGFVLVASLIRLTGIVPQIAYNLAIPLLFALTLTAAFSVGYNLTEGLRRRMRLAVSGRTTIVAGVGTALLVVVIGNLDGAAQLLQATWRTIENGPFGHFEFWRSSRLMPGQISITEFPFWTFLFADLHAHLISLPFQVTIVGLAVNLALSASRSVSMMRRLPGLAWLALTVGSLAAINTWDVPAYALLSVAVIAIVVFVSHRGPLSAKAIGKWVLWSAGFWAAFYLLFLPFHQSYDSPFSGFHMSQWRTVAWHYMGIHGLLFFISGTWIAVEGYRKLVARPRLSSGPGAAPVSAFREPWVGSKRLMLALSAISLTLVLVLWVSAPLLHQWTTVAFLMLVGVVVVALMIWWAAHRERPEAPLQMLLLTMLILALGIGIGVDFVTADRDIDRMNTVFKFYLNAWVFWSLVSGAGLWYLWATGALRWRGTSASTYVVGSPAWRRWVVRAMRVTGRLSFVAAVWSVLVVLGLLARDTVWMFVVLAVIAVAWHVCSSGALQRQEPAKLLRPAGRTWAAGLVELVVLGVLARDTAWMLVLLGAVAAAWHVWLSGALGWREPGRLRHPVGAWLGLLVVLVMASIVFPVLGTRDRIDDRFDDTLGLTLDGTAYQEVAINRDVGPRDNGSVTLYPLAPDAEALEFIRENVEGSPVFLEAVTNQYRWTPRVAKYTGLPVVVGWRWHQAQQRGAGGSEPANVDRRVADVKTMYGTTDTARLAELLDQYNVAYIYLGTTERLYFSEAGIAKFDELVGSMLEVAFTNGDITVYRVLPHGAASA